jgi:hypothetical protein
MRVFPISALLTGVLSVASVAQGNAIVNGDFETGTFAGWTVGDAPSGSLLFVGRAPSGSEAASFGAIGLVEDSMSQTFATVPGEIYQVSFWLAHGRTDTSNDFGAWWDGAPLLFLNNAPRFGGTEYDFLATATSDTTLLKFGGRELVNYYELDNVRVTPVVTSEAAVAPLVTPEPLTLLLVATGATVLVRQRRRDLRKTRSLTS